MHAEAPLKPNEAPQGNLDAPCSSLISKSVRHEHLKSRITILNDRECPISVGTQSYTIVTESYGSGMVGRGRPSTPDS